MASQRAQTGNRQIESAALQLDQHRMDLCRGFTTGDGRRRGGIGHRIAVARLGFRIDRRFRVNDGVSKRKRRKFEPEFKADAIRLVLEEGRSISDVAKSLDIYPSSLSDWVKHARDARGAAGNEIMNSGDLEEIRRLQSMGRRRRSQRGPTWLQTRTGS